MLKDAKNKKRGKTEIFTIIWLKIAFKDGPTLSTHSTLVPRSSQTKF
jgi:hypothetical protein